MENALRQPVYTPLTLREIKPAGWLMNQLKIQAKGLSGNLDKFWPDIRDSQWIGGSAEGWERVPYWLDGFIPLAWLIGDADMKARATRYIGYIIEHQQPDGWICPDSSAGREKYDVWALFLLLKVLVVYHDATGDERIAGTVERALRALDRHIDTATLFAWGQTRWFECLIPLFWLYERTGGEWLLSLASKLRCQGFDWLSFFKLWPYRRPDEKGRWSQMSHVVNNAMMLKSGALLWRLTGSEDDLRAAEGIVDLLDRYHGTAVGVFTGDECLGGQSPVRGTELCAVAEYLYSLEHLLSVTGDARWGDRLERIAFNALPATFSPDMWSHQYDQQANQVQCSFQEQPVFGTNGGYSHTFGLEPNYGCCTANLSQPWPKFAASLVMRSFGGLAVLAYAPCIVETEVNGAHVKLAVDTEYPFRDTVRITVETERAVEFPLELRIPGWARGAEVLVEGESLHPAAGAVIKLARMWSGSTALSLLFPMAPTLEERPNGLFTLERGPLVYSLAIEERWARINEDIPGREFPHCDYEIYPESAWNYGLMPDGETLLKGLEFVDRPVGEMPFSPSGAPVVAVVKGKKVDWELVDDSAAPVPGLKWVSDEVESLKLLPYGCTNLRLTEFPLVEKK